MDVMETNNIRCEISGGLYCGVAGLEVFPVVLFVGSDKVVGDALAPICGSMLKKMMPQCFIYGDLQNPVNAKNLQPTLGFIKAVHKGHKILVVDASIGKKADIGKIKFVAGGINPGKAVGRNFDAVGDFSIIGIVAHRDEKTCGISPVRLYFVVEMAREIAREIYLCNRSFTAKPKIQVKTQTSIASVCP